MGDDFPDLKDGPPVDPKVFATTRWTRVIKVQEGTREEAEMALDELCRAYWHPIRSYFERALRNPHDAEDLTQDYFMTMLRRDFLSGVSREKGKFRSWLLKAAQRVLIDHLEKKAAKVRGGGMVHVSVDARDEDDRPLIDVAENRNAEAAFKREYASALLERVFQQMEARFVDSRRGDDSNLPPADAFALLLPCVLKSNNAGYEEIGRRLGKSEGAVKQWVRRLREDFAKLFRSQVVDTLSSPDEFEEEIRDLLGALES